MEQGLKKYKARKFAVKDLYVKFFFLLLFGFVCLNTHRQNVQRIVQWAFDFSLFFI